MNDYIPPPAFTHVNVQALMHQTSSSIHRWGDLQKALDVACDSAAANLAAQAQARVSLKRDLTNLTQLADAQSKHIQKGKDRQRHAVHATKAPAAAEFSGSGRAPATAVGSAVTRLDATVRPTPPSLLSSAATPEEVTPRGDGMATSGEAYSFPLEQARDLNPSGSSPAMLAVRAAGVSVPKGPPLHGTSVATDTEFARHGAVGTPGTTHVSQASAELDRADDAVRARGVRHAEWPAATAIAALPSSHPPTPAHNTLPLQQRLYEVKQRLDRTEPRNKWVVLVDAAIRLLPHESPTYKQFFITIQSLLNSYNGAEGVEIAQALRSCMDPRVFDPVDIKLSQERMAGVYSQWARRSQR